MIDLTGPSILKKNFLSVCIWVNYFEPHNKCQNKVYFSFTKTKFNKIYKNLSYIQGIGGLNKIDQNVVNK